MGLGRGRKKGKKRERENSQDEPECVSHERWITLKKVEEEQCIKRKNGEIAMEGDDTEREAAQEGHTSN